MGCHYGNLKFGHLGSINALTSSTYRTLVDPFLVVILKVTAKVRGQLVLVNDLVKVIQAAQETELERYMTI